MKNMDLPIDKNKRWVESLHKKIDQLDDDIKAIVMKEAGKSCVSDILKLCEEQLGHKIDTIQDLVNGWNLLRGARNLEGKWELEGERVHGTFGECGCPLVRSGLVELHPLQCLCSKGMIEVIFSEVAQKEVEVVIERSIGQGDDACEIIVQF